MVFSGQVILKGQENPVAFKDHFTLGEPLYGRFYLKEALHQVASERGQSGKLFVYGIDLRASVDGRVVSDGVFPMQANWQTYNFTLLRAPSDTVPWAHPSWFLSEVAPKLAPGTHRLDLAVLAVPPGARTGAGAPLATGSLTLLVRPGSSGGLAGALARERQLERASQQEGEGAASASSSSGSSSETPAAAGAHFDVLDREGCDKNLTLLIQDGAGGRETTYIGTGESMEKSIEQAPGWLCVADDAGNQCASNQAPITASTKGVSIGSGCHSVTSR